VRRARAPVEWIRRGGRSPVARIHAGRSLLGRLVRLLVRLLITRVDPRESAEPGRVRAGRRAGVRRPEAATVATARRAATSADPVLLTGEWAIGDSAIRR
jgi:hypothetical protein